MRDALNVLHPGVTDGFVLLERTTSTGKRLGLVCCVDLEQYRYDGAKTLIRPTEETVASRLPARLAVRNGAPLESSHVMLLLDDQQRTVIEPLYATSFPRFTTSTSCSRAAMHAAGRSRPTRTNPPSPPP